MGLFSKIFGGAPGESSEAPEGDAPATDAAVSEHAPVERRADTAPTKQAAARVAASGTMIIDDPQNGARRSAQAESPATLRGGPEAQKSARPAPRPTLSAKVEARVHAQPTTPIGAREVAPAQNGAPSRVPKRTTADVTPSPLPPMAAPPPKPSAPSRGPTPPAASRAPAKKVLMTATLPLGGGPAAPPKAKPGNGAAQVRPAEALVLEPLAGGAPVATPAMPSSDPDDVDRAFDRIAPTTTGARGVPGALADDAMTKAENAKLFGQMVVDHARPLRDFMLELAVGPTTKQWLDVARPATDSILKGARALEQADLTAALADFEKALSHAAQAAGSKIGKSERSSLMSAYDRLAALLPSAFEWKGDRDRREPLVVHHLLLQIPGIHKVTLDKLYAAGLASLEALCRSSAEDLVAIGRLEADSAHAIIRRFQAYWRERTEEPPQKAEERAKHKLRQLVSELQKAHAEFQSAEAEEDRERKRRARNERRERALAMNVLLAQLGEVDLVEELERSHTERRIERVQRYIAEPHHSSPAF